MGDQQEADPFGAAEPQQDPFGAPAGGEQQPVQDDAFGAAPADDSFAQPAAPIEGDFGDSGGAPAAVPSDDFGGGGGMAAAPSDDFGAPIAQDSGFAPLADQTPVESDHFAAAAMEEPESNRLTEWEQQWENDLQAKQAEQDAIGDDRKAKAKSELEQFYAEREKQREATQEKNRNEEQVLQEKLEADLESDNPWGRVVALVDIEVKSGVDSDAADMSRMRQIMVQMKNEPAKA